MTRDDIKRHLISAGITFVATFALFFFGLMSSDGFTFSRDTLVSGILGGLVAGSRAVGKIIFEWASTFLASKKS